LNSRIRRLPGWVLIRSPGLRWVPRVPVYSRAPRTSSNGGPSAAVTTASAAGGVVAGMATIQAAHKSAAHKTRLAAYMVFMGLFIVIPVSFRPVALGLGPAR